MAPLIHLQRTENSPGVSKHTKLKRRNFSQDFQSSEKLIDWHQQWTVSCNLGRKIDSHTEREEHYIQHTTPPRRNPRPKTEEGYKLRDLVMMVSGVVYLHLAHRLDA